MSRGARRSFIDRQTAAAIKRKGYDRAELPLVVEMLIVLGGDGTLLSAARHVADAHTNVPIFGVNLGSLGFMAEVSLDELYDNLEKAIAGKLETEDRMMLSASVIRDGKRIARYRVLNDAVINKGALARMMELRITVSDGHLTTLTGGRIDRGNADRIDGLFPFRGRTHNPSDDPLFRADAHLPPYAFEPAYRPA